MVCSVAKSECVDELGKNLDELERRKQFAYQMGGEDSIAFHHNRGKLTIRERIELLQDHRISFF